MCRDSGNFPRKFRGDGAMAHLIPYPDIVGGWLRGHYGQERGAEKRLAQRVGCSPRTVENWLRGLSAPSGEQLLRLMAECDGLAGEIMAEVARRRGE